jgi:hypothetical protein
MKRTLNTENVTVRHKSKPLTSTCRSLVLKLVSFIDDRSIFVVIFRLDGAPVVATGTALGDGGIHAIAGL